MRTKDVIDQLTSMTIADAKEKCLQYRYLVGTVDKKDEIGELVVVPADDKHHPDIIFRAAQNMDYDELLDGYNDFTVIALLNLADFPFNSNLYWRYLDDILKERP